MFPIGTLSQQGAGGTSSLLTGLVSWFPMGETDGQHKADVHGSNTTNVSQSIANLTQVTGKQGSGTDFPNGSSVHCQPPTGIPSGANDWSVALWVNLNALTTDTMDHIVSITTSGLTSNIQDAWHISYRAGAEDAFDVTIRVNTTRYNQNASTFGTPSTGTWYFLYAYHDSASNEIGISINNGTVDSTTYSGTPNTQTASFNIGRWAYTGGFPFYLDGKLDEIGVWNRTLTTDELTWLYNAGSGRSYTDLGGQDEYFSSSWTPATPVALNTRLGFRFTVSEDMEVNYLSCYVGSILGELVYIHRVSDGAVIANIECQGTAATWVNVSIPPVTLLSTEEYTCSARASGSSRNVYRNPTGLTWEPRITVTANVFGSDETIPTSTTANIYPFPGFGWAN